MRNSVVFAVGGSLLCGLAALALPAADFPPAVPRAELVREARPDPRPDLVGAAGESSRIPFVPRFQTLGHGGIVRAANSAISCRTAAEVTAGQVKDADSACTTVRSGGEGRGDGGAANQEFDMLYSDVDKDPNTYNSTQAGLRLPDGAGISYARLYWGGNLRVGEQKPAADNGRVLFAEPGGDYRSVLADTVIGHRTSSGADAYQASADVTPIVRKSGPGTYTVAQLNVAMGRSAVGAWGGWTLVVVYEKKDAPLRHLSVWDGFESLGTSRTSTRVDFGPMRMPLRATGRLGVVGYDGDRGQTGDTLTAETDRGWAVGLGNDANPSDDVMNSSITDAGSGQIERLPSYANTLGYDSDVFDLSPALALGGDRLGVRIATGRDSVWLGALFVEAAAQD
jgi:hypothetical protein